MGDVFKIEKQEWFVYTQVIQMKMHCTDIIITAIQFLLPLSLTYKFNIITTDKYVSD